MVAFLVTGCAGTARIAEPEVYNFDCDVPAAKSSEWNRTVRGNSAKASGTVQLIEPRQDERWWPVASIFFLGDGDSRRTGLRFMLARENPNKLQMLVQGPDENAERVTFGEAPWRDGPIPFSVSIDSSGKLTVSAAGNVHTLQLGKFKITKFALSCSTAQFEFADVSVIGN